MKGDNKIAREAERLMNQVIASVARGDETHRCEVGAHNGDGRVTQWTGVGEVGRLRRLLLDIQHCVDRHDITEYQKLLKIDQLLKRC